MIVHGTRLRLGLSYCGSVSIQGHGVQNTPCHALTEMAQASLDEMESRRDVLKLLVNIGVCVYSAYWVSKGHGVCRYSMVVGLDV